MLSQCSFAICTSPWIGSLILCSLSIWFSAPHPILHIPYPIGFHLTWFHPSSIGLWLTPRFHPFIQEIFSQHSSVLMQGHNIDYLFASMDALRCQIHCELLTSQKRKWDPFLANFRQIKLSKVKSASSGQLLGLRSLEYLLTPSRKTLTAVFLGCNDNLV